MGVPDSVEVHRGLPKRDSGDQTDRTDQETNLRKQTQIEGEFSLKLNAVDIVNQTNWLNQKPICDAKYLKK